MNKFTKASIATGAGIVLLLGGAGTFAYWNDAEDLAPGTITSGTLTLEQGTAAGVWTDTSDNSTITDLGDFLIVPGDKLVYTKSIAVNATGDNLLAVLSADTTDMVGGALADDVTVSVEAVTTDLGVTNVGDEVHITAALAGSSTIDVRVVVEFPWGTANGTVGQGQSIDLTDLKLVLNQVASF
jgi:alternate signal-mediated exported protein